MPHTFPGVSPRRARSRSRSRRLSWVAALALSCAASAWAVTARAATPEQVDKAIEKAKANLLSRLRGGNWEGADGPRGGAKLGQEGGITALCTYALLAAEQSPQEPQMQQAVKYLLADSQMTGIYALGMRCQVWNLLPQKPEIKEAVKKDGALLLQAAHPASDGLGAFFRYKVTSKDFDHSASQYGILGLWACAENGFEVPTPFWKAADEGWRKHQQEDGGWTYLAAGPPRASMTAAGIATLFITQEYLHAGDGVDCRGNIRDPNIDKGIKWMSDHFSSVLAGRNNLYTLYGVERIGVASGHKYFGTVDWYKQGADHLVKGQEADGSWGTLHDTAFGILFLVRGRAPVVLNKLEYEIDQNGDKPKPANWDQRPRDAARLTHWMSKQLERFLNWQIVNLKVPVEDLHDSPILYVSGNQPLNFTPAELDKLKLYVEQGGIVVGNADCASDNFSKSFKKIAGKMFPYEFRELPADSPIYTNEQFRRDKWPTKISVQAMSNGAREMFILFPTGDPSRFWQTGAYGGHEQTHQVMDDIFLYGCEKQNLRNKGVTYIVNKNSAAAKSSIKVARLQYAGNWDPEPAGWRQLAAALHNRAGADLAVETVPLGSGKLNNSFKAAHLTGTAKFSLPEPARTELRKYLEDGGTLILDAAGGQFDFAAAAAAEVEALFPGSKPATLKADDPALTAGGKVDVAYRAFTLKKSPDYLKGPRIKGVMVKGRTAIYLSEEDMSVGLVGQPVDGIFGYTPAAATGLMSSLLQHAAGPAAAPVKTAAGSTPAVAKEQAAVKARKK